MDYYLFFASEEAGFKIYLFKFNADLKWTVHIAIKTLPGTIHCNFLKSRLNFAEIP